ncbi:pyruvyl transferase [Psychromonas sp. RZ22]|uniref:polysaccharide pyruvyl transferase family protein n=1 Tax=Psychromonas algarum TaxID=2555643 RepID=UPI0010671ED0|nr:polysaccharide pyruvyl transferase family protein [Psychromonas sp. RZ22]TEW56156.1 pyruvyl transferase [Psychromonas sp. RZ22]
MKLTYFKDKIPNFGDELNKVMWDALIEPDFFDQDKSTLFLGIGSILWNDFPKESKKIVMGSGYGGYTGKPDMHDGTWDVAFVRGPRTAKTLNLSPNIVITDAAILTRFMGLANQEKKFKVSFMSHFQSIPRGNWKEVCKKGGINYIDPTNPDVLRNLQEIQQSELVITEAMHGAILADTLRTPWIALKPIVSTHHNKWYDWSESLNIDLQFNQSPSSSIQDLWANKTGNVGLGKRSTQLGKALSFSDPYFINHAAEQLLKLVKQGGQMSDEKIFNDKSYMALDKLSQYCKLQVS